MAYNPKILEQVLGARALSRSALSLRLGIKLDEFEEELQRQPEPKQSFLNELAKELTLPKFVFYMREAPPLDDVLPDFRSATPKPAEISRFTTRSIQFATAVQTTVVELDAPGVVELPPFGGIRNQTEIEEYAIKIREFFNITLEDQINSRDANEFYVVCRKKIENQGIYVLHDSFPETDGSGFCLAHPSHPVIVINTRKQTRGRRLFTLIHELGHVLMGQSGISDPFIRQNAIEARCNRFAASFLAPKIFISALLRNVTPDSDPDLEDVAWAARRLRISQQAAVIRLEELGLYAAGSHEKWLTAVHNLGNPDFSEKRGGPPGEPPAQEKVKLSRYGFRFAAIFAGLLRQGRISEINLFRATGLKPKYQRPYFDYANSITDSELSTVEFDDG